MADVLTPAQRHLNMSRIRGQDTKPEKLLRKGLHSRGLRYRLHVRTLPGRPDLVFPRFRAVIQVHGCFWHGHHCPMFKMPATRTEFWIKKLNGNRDRDQKTLRSLRQDNWRVLTIWECSLRGPARRTPDEVVRFCQSFLSSHQVGQEVSGRWDEVYSIVRDRAGRIAFEEKR
ncbi:DNA mismatch endonuclease Vsr [Bradyrhizobium sp. AUGA SZCCT0169]|uniref:very short patch repair endonuclease n=1 Tax=Bradyrhizobium sp. AUGA SZCCT0169 TaxID=2807663 RepID=UPI001BA5763C|nr:very short patch repair endonuclease [Bradyrhizobium sp. AUGA SZCCT0169]MBR1247501.1 DNA mismatch endonuclease Vsr [Bradyrhizobium sp. AUGA SZCCT0169]